MANNYMILSNSDASLVKRFKAVSWVDIWQRTDDVNIAVDGSVDKSAGEIIYQKRYTLRIPYQVTDSNYGTLEDFQTFFEYNNPQGTPSDVMTLTDHYGDVWNVFFVGNVSPNPVSTIIDGAAAWWLVPVTFYRIGEVVGS